MSRRLAVLGVFTVFAVLASAATADTPRISFQIATGSTLGIYFPVGEAIAGIISHPPGVNRCEAVTVCGPAGLIASARTSEGTMENLLSVNGGDVDSGLAQSDVVAAAVRGDGPFKSKGKQVHVRVIASLFNEEVHLLAADKANIKSVSDLKGKRVSFGAERSGVGVTAREILSAYRIPEARLKLVYADLPTSVALIRQGKLDAFFAVGGVPIAGVGDLLANHVVKLVPITGAQRDRLVKNEPSLVASTLSYPGQDSVPTVSTRATWIVRDSAQDNLVYGITRALFNPANREALGASHPSAREIGLATAALAPPAPLHPGAARFYAEAARNAQR